MKRVYFQRCLYRTSSLKIEENLWAISEALSLPGEAITLGGTHIHTETLEGASLKMANVGGPQTCSGQTTNHPLDAFHRQMLTTCSALFPSPLILFSPALEQSTDM